MGAIENTLVAGRNDLALEDLFSRYRVIGEPIHVKFRELVPWLRSTERATHLIHTYPAKLLMQIPHFFLANNIISQPGDTILDPFCGSGTVLLEALLAGRDSLGADCNPLARLISQVKTSAIQPGEINRGVATLRNSIPEVASIDVPDIVNREYWFTPRIVNELLRVLEGIQRTKDVVLRNFFMICFSNCVRRISLADPNLSVPVRLRADKYPDGHRLRAQAEVRLRRLAVVNAIEEFFVIVSVNSARFAALEGTLTGSQQTRSHIISADAGRLSLGLEDSRPLPNECVQAVITSPPYAGAQKYVRACSLSLGWLGFGGKNELRKYEAQTIGREHFRKATYLESQRTGVSAADQLLEEIWDVNPLRAHIAATYLVEMAEAFREMVRVLKPGGYVVLVAANNKVCGRDFRTQEYLTSMLQTLGLELKLTLVDGIRSRSLLTKRRNTASVISEEWVAVLQKNGGVL